jgi:methionine-rich copper-binding protein CopC
LTLLAFASLAAVLVAPSPVAVRAHASLDRAEPPPDARLTEAPSELRLFFTQALVRRGSYVQVRDAREVEVPVQLGFDDANPRLMRAGLPALQPGSYTVKWQSLSADDDDYADGTYKLTVLGADGRAPDESGSGSADGRLGTIVLPAAAAAAIVALAIVAWRWRTSKR